MGNTPIKSKKIKETTPLLTNDQDVEPKLGTAATIAPVVAKPTTQAKQLEQIEAEEARMFAIFLADIESRKQPMLNKIANHDTAALSQETAIFKRRQPPVEEKSSWFSCFCFFRKKEIREEEKPLLGKRGIN
ncbi:MAG: hypothetical protein WAW86_00660 [Gammaproteobacteria bacterium]